MPSARAGERLFDTRLDVALWLSSRSSKLGDYEVAYPLKHALFAERERLEVAQVGKVLQNVCDLEDVARAHLFREVLEAILPVSGRAPEVVREVAKEHLALGVRYGGA